MAPFYWYPSIAQMVERQTVEVSQRQKSVGHRFDSGYWDVFLPSQARGRCGSVLRLTRFCGGALILQNLVTNVQQSHVV